jgi:hypothetical protein
MQRHGLDPKRAAGALYAQGDFTTIGDDDFFDHLGAIGCQPGG